MALTMTIGGVTTVFDEGSLEIAATASGVDRLTAAVTSIDGSVQPAMDAEVIVDRDGTRMFGGILDEPEEGGFQNVGLTPITTRITAKDFNVYAEWRLVFATIPAGTLKAALTALLPYLSPYGVTLDPAQADGSTLPKLTYAGKTVAEVFAHLEQLTEYTYLRNISYTKVLGFYAVGLTAAPFDVADGDSYVVGDLVVRPKRSGYANRVLVFAGSGQSWVTQTWTADGVETSWVTDIAAAGPAAGYVVVGGTYMTVGTGAQYEWDATTHTLSVGTASTPPNGTVISLNYLAQWPYIAQADDAAEQALRGIREYSLTAADVFDLTVADAIAEAELARRVVAAVRIAQYATYDHGLAPGQVQTITKSGRHVSASFLITDVVARDQYAHIRYDVTAIEGSIRQASWRDVYRAWSGGAAASMGSVTVGSGGTAVSSWISPAYLGGSRNTAVTSDGATYQPVSNGVPFVAGVSFSGVLRVDLWAREAGVGVTVRLYNVTDATVDATTAKVTATVATETTVSVALVAGKKYRAEVVSDAAGKAVFAAAVQLESL